MSPDQKEAMQQIDIHARLLKTDLESIQFMINKEDYIVDVALFTLEAVVAAAKEAVLAGPGGKPRFPRINRA